MTTQYVLSVYYQIPIFTQKAYSDMILSFLVNFERLIAIPPFLQCFQKLTAEEVSEVKISIPKAYILVAKTKGKHKK